jgi:hypothetical protein
MFQIYKLKTIKLYVTYYETGRTKLLRKSHILNNINLIIIIIIMNNNKLMDTLYASHLAKRDA